MPRQIGEAVRIDSVLAPVDIHGGAAETGTWVSMGNYRRVLAYVTTSAVAAGKDITIQLMQAKDAAGTGSKVLSSLVTVTNTGGAGAPLTASVEAQASDLDLANGFGYVTAQVTCNDTVAVQGTAVLIRGSARFGTSAS